MEEASRVSIHIHFLGVEKWIIKRHTHSKRHHAKMDDPTVTDFLTFPICPEQTIKISWMSVANSTDISSKMDSHLVLKSADFLPNCAHICLDNQLILAKFNSLGCSLRSHPRLFWRQKMSGASTLHINFENCVIFRSTPTVYHHVFSLIDFALLLLRLPPSNIMLHILQYAIFYHTFYLLQP